MNSPRVLFYVQHLLGIGHLVRAARIAKALAESGFDTRLVLGGTEVPGLDAGAARIVQLPPVRMGEGGFHALAHADGTAFDAEAQGQRRTQLLDVFDRFAPDILVIEAFPFGRRQMRFELLPLLERARARATPPLIATSIRDILQANRRPERIAETLQHVERDFDLVLVHGDPALARLEDSFPESVEFASKAVYTGLVAPPPPPEPTSQHAAYDVVVSAGGGAVGAPLLRAALGARRSTRLAARPWLLLTGPNMPPALRAELANGAEPGVTIEPFVPNLAAVLRRARLSVSQAGYNTVADVLVAGPRSVLVPYATDGETEQSVRARHLDAMGLAVCLNESELAPDTLARAIDRALESRPPAHALCLDGAANTARVLWSVLERRGTTDPESR